MLHSMTGYGSTSFISNNLSLEIEIKTLNSKFFDSKISFRGLNIETEEILPLLKLL